ncbi:MAG: hypothetical protein D6813_09420 [Calditrichaeota bacterium]|nr:MAG: hypothetical protein D6813_09420 [Calditrichota bacterium]
MASEGISRFWIDGSFARALAITRYSEDICPLFVTQLNTRNADEIRSMGVTGEHRNQQKLHQEQIHLVSSLNHWMPRKLFFSFPATKLLAKVLFSTVYVRKSKHRCCEKKTHSQAIHIQDNQRD